MNVTSQGVIFTVPQICAYFLDNPNNLEIDSFKIAVSEHILLYFKNSNSFFLCTHDNVRHTLCMLYLISCTGACVESKICSLDLKILLLLDPASIFLTLHKRLCLMVYFRFRQVDISHTSTGYVYSFTF